MRIMEADLEQRENVTFRFRNAEKIIEYRELEDLYLYFCPYSEEDDVLEGLANLYWQADEILWRNFFAHYLLVLFFYITSLVFAVDDTERESITRGKIVWRLSRKDFQIEDIISNFFNQKIVTIIIRAITSKSHKVRYDELKFYIRTIHLVALYSIRKNTFGVDDVMPSNSESPFRCTEDLMKDFFEDFHWNSMNDDGVFRVLDKRLFKCYDEFIYHSGQMSTWEKWLIIDFPAEYFKLMNEISFPNWYLVSFCKNCTDVRNWAQYGDYNKGICLVFRTHDSSIGRGLRLKTCHSWSSDKGKIFEQHIEPLREVTIAEHSPELNFFSYLGNIPERILKEWCTSPDGRLSEYYVNNKNHVEQDIWHRDYWEKFQHIVLQKSKAWEGLSEERIVLTDGLIMNYMEKDDRKIHYDFIELQGIIWGCRTADEHKNTIRNIIKKLCNEYKRTNFEFYQAVEDRSNLKLWIEKEI